METQKLKGGKGGAGLWALQSLGGVGAQLGSSWLIIFTTANGEKLARVTPNFHAGQRWVNICDVLM